MSEVAEKNRLKLTLVSAVDQNNLVQQPESAVIHLNVGQQLASARVRQEISVEQIAGQLKWSERQIAEIEAGNYSVFPDVLTVRGFVRAYAKILKIDPTLLMRDLAAEYGKFPAKPLDRPKLDMPFSAGRVPLSGLHSGSSQKILGTIILALLCLLAVFVWRDELLDSIRVIYPTNTNPFVEHPDVTVASQKSHEQTNAVAQAYEKNKLNSVNSEPIAQNPVSIFTDESSHAVSEAKASNLVAKDDQHKTAVTQSEQPPKSTKVIVPANTLVLKFKQDSWIQIKHANGSVIISRLYRAGSEELINVSEPLNMVIGNAPGVQATLRGQGLALPLQAGSNVVKLSVK